MPAPGPDRPGAGVYPGRMRPTAFSPAAGSPVLVLLETDADGAPAPRLADPAVPHLSVTDQGVTRGDGIFETALAVADGLGTLRMRKLGAHLGRLAASAAALQLAAPEAAAWEAAVALGLRAFTEANDVAPGDRLAVRLTVTRGPEIGSAAGRESVLLMV